MTMYNSTNTPIMSKGATVAHAGPGWLIMKAGVANVYLVITGAAGAGVDQLQVNCDTGFTTDGTLHHIIITYDGSKTTAGVKFYVNNVLKGNADTSDNFTGDSSNANSFLLGSDGTSFGAYDEEEIGIFNYVFSANDRADMYGAGSANVFTPA